MCMYPILKVCTSCWTNIHFIVNNMVSCDQDNVYSTLHSTVVYSTLYSSLGPRLSSKNGGREPGNEASCIVL